MPQETVCRGRIREDGRQSGVSIGRGMCSGVRTVEAKCYNLIPFASFLYLLTFKVMNFITEETQGGDSQLWPVRADVGAMQEFQMAVCPLTTMKCLCPVHEEVSHLPQDSSQETIVHKEKQCCAAIHSNLHRGCS